MGVAPHVLTTRLLRDLEGQFDPKTFMRIKAKEEWPGISFRESAAVSIVKSLTQKWEGNLNAETKAKALTKFMQVNEDCDKWRLATDEESQYGDDFLLNELKQFIWRFWHRSGSIPLVDHDYDCLAKGAHGPGSAIGSRGGDFYTKLFSSKMAVTSPHLYESYKRYIRSFPEWKNAESTRTLSYGEPDVVEGNRLDFVPKNDDISRTICVEPSLNMFYQLGFAHILNSRLKEVWGIDLEFQQFKNRELARKGSLDGSFATIDLSSASDSISVKMLKWLLPRDWFNLLVRYRSPTSRLPNGKRLTLHMISTMGNGFTFPLQTIIFVGVVLAAFRMHGLAPVHPFGLSEGNFGVNGDDIVVPSAISLKVLRLLHLLGFKANPAKTFVEGPFRESCGGDYFYGRNLRGVYIRKLSEPQDYYSAINQLNLFSTRTGIYLSQLVQFLLARVKYRPVPLWENDDAGVKVPFSVVRRQLRLDPDTQSFKYSAWIPIQPPYIRLGEGELYTPRAFKSREYNSSGLLLACVQGSVNSKGIPLIPKCVRYRAKTRVASSWDIPVISDVEAVRLFQGRFDLRRWESVAYLNLFR